MTPLDLVLATCLAITLALVWYAYVGYPAVVSALARLFGRVPVPPAVGTANLPSVALVGAAQIEERDIEARIQNVLAVSDPRDRFEIVIASNGSTDATNKVVRSYADRGIVLLDFPTNRGKAAVLNDAVGRGNGDAVLLSDANTHKAPDAFRGLAEWFADPAVGVARGKPAGTAGPRTGLVRLILSDLRAKAAWNYESAGWKSVVKVLLTDGTAAMVWYRLMQWARRWRLVPLEMLFNKINTVCCSCIIGRGAEFGPGFVLVHSQGVVINGTVRGGRDVKIEHQVTIGAERRRSPLVGDDVFVGAGAKILGEVTIGDGARVGANAVVVADVPAHTTVVGIPARVVRHRVPGELGPASPTNGVQRARFDEKTD
jgi:serine O-acetyltransferase